VGWGERQWQRACQAELGVSPKFLLRLNRLHASVRSRMACRAEPLVQHAVDAGFFDQAHMAREYRLLAGLAPRESLARAAGAATALGASQLAPRFFSR
jgi:transcriptional regulator GlxA family with amidase domain